MTAPDDEQPTPAESHVFPDGTARQWDGTQWAAPLPPVPPKTSHRTRNIILGVVGVLVLLGAVGAIAGNSGTSGTSAAQTRAVLATASLATETLTPSYPADPTTEATTEEPEPTPTPTADNTGTFGVPFNYTDGMSMIVSKPVAFTPDEYAAGTTGFKYFLNFTVTLGNNTGKVITPYVNANVQSASVEGSEIFDGNHDGGPHVPLLPGRSIVFTLGFGVTNPADVVFSIAPGFDYDTAIFTSK